VHDAFSPGAVLAGRYQLAQRLGADGLTERWAATDLVLARAVVVETVARGAGPAADAAFGDTVGVVARLVHPGAAATYDSGRVGDRPFVVTEQPPGLSLAELLERHGPLPARRVTIIGRQAALALDAAHRRGVVHGGVDADAVVVGDDDRVKLAGFVAAGVRSRLQGAPPAPGDDVHDLAVTLTAALPAVERTAPGPWPDVQGGPTGGGPVGESARLVRALLDARPGGPLRTAAALATALGAEPTGPGGPASGPTPAVAGAPGPPTRLSAPGGVAAVGDGGTTPGHAGSHGAGPRPERDPTPVMGIGPVPGAAQRPRPTGRAGPPPAPRQGRLVGIVVATLVVVALVVAGFVLTHRSRTSSPGPGPSPTTGGPGGGPAVVAAHSFNPFSPDNPAKTENESQVGRTIDGNPSTVWSTSEYATPAFGNLKSGTGVYLTIGRAAALRQLQIISPSRGWRANVYVAPAPAHDLAGWGTPIGPTVTVSAATTTVDLRGTNGAAVLVWITALSPQPAAGAPAATPYRVDIAELVLH